MYRLLILNPGSTSTKIAVYDDEKPVFTENVSHSLAELGRYRNVMDQLPMREKVVATTLAEHGIPYASLSAVISRGGLLPPVKSGAYKVNEDMVWQLTHAPVNEHASNMGAVIADRIARQYGIPAYIYDAVTVDEMTDLAKVTGFPGTRRRGMGHNLNMRAAAIRYAKEQGKAYRDCTLIVAHMGGGITLSLHHNGTIEDFVSDENGPYSPERAGDIPSYQLVDICYSGKYTHDELLKLLHGKGGLLLDIGLTDGREIEKKIAAGDAKAKLFYDGMALNIARYVGLLSIYVSGKVDGIILTGGIAYSHYIVDFITQHVRFIAPVVVYPGEKEMESLAYGGLRVLRGEEKAYEFVKSVNSH
ncbi:MAG: butyrate kinase [Spirochaetia bacterium]|jgi:butyrate kinase|nr:butyrate kinase [Spirochaetia bacterium]